MVVAHVEAAALQQGFHRVHVAFRAAGEHLPLEEVRDQLLKLLDGQPAGWPLPVRFVPVALAEEEGLQAWHGAFEARQLIAENDVFRGAGAVHEHDVQVGMQIRSGASHGHHRRYPRARREVEQLSGRCGYGGEDAGRAGSHERITGTQVVVQPVGDDAARHPLDRNAEGEGARRRRRQGIAAGDALAVHHRRHGEELPWFVCQRVIIRAMEHECLDVVGFVHDGQAFDSLGFAARPLHAKGRPVVGVGEALISPQAGNILDHAHHH
ncbi:hypothetical protein D3C76_1109240 [compost metagenome]